MRIKVATEGSIQVSVRVLVLKEMLPADFDSADFYREIFGEAPPADETISVIKETINGFEYVGVEVEFIDKDEQRDFSFVAVNRRANSLTFRIKGSELKKIIADAWQQQNSNLTLDDLKSYGVSFTLSVIMPNDIVKAQGGKVNGNALTIDLYDIPAGQIKAVSALDPTREIKQSWPPEVWLILITLAVIIVVIVLIKGSSKQEDGNNQSPVEALMNPLLAECDRDEESLQ